ncbi:uncharacterized protein BKA55DRAFT_316442 [Fusarium redolens]|uniref:Uncharacterized protein n=1 Tax=Fusarium redolens TaxID=48865 RepID=A0A9P9HEF6_FUSRE|nr:uncharacterized protein BKA55DRAFT_316442 [Fusarium redolens]KAH7255428.1 hypothetical protein BKA55DRAFT_316442 [Fusarium redolens]
MLAKLRHRLLVVLFECPSCVAPFQELFTRKPASPIHACLAFPIVSDTGYYLLCFMRPRNGWPEDSRCGPRVVSWHETPLALKVINQHIPIFRRHHWSLPSANGLALTQACIYPPQDIDERRPDPLPSKY